jgi:hypothetical protein
MDLDQGWGRRFQWRAGFIRWRSTFLVEHSPYAPWHGTTIVTVRKGGKVVIAGDGQVSIGQTVIKHNARKVRRLTKGEVIAGFAGATADAFTLLERLAWSSPKTGAPTAISVVWRR